MGARWGDLEEMDLDDILIDLQKRRVEIQQVKQVKAKRLAFKVTPSIQPVEFTHVKPHFKRNAKHSKTCIGCKKFAVHSNPPSHFTEEDKMHCCAYCNVTHGKKHGGSCEKTC